MSIKGFICDAEIRTPNGEDEYAYAPTDLIVVWDREQEVMRLTVVSHGLQIEFSQYQAFTFSDVVEKVYEASGEAGV